MGCNSTRSQQVLRISQSIRSSTSKWDDHAKSGGVPYEIESETLDTVGRFDVIDGYDCLRDSGVNGSVGKQGLNHASIWDVVARFLKPILHGQ
ncbi:hypothetical protein IFM89_001646 [Coptis chinensis]|uniref:Uncharacterized protein n=1 Tax=Coptis chinensis TaxID=261450 RepID=A0A835HI47_9MAGN|nr:hypothetical protein IFM89_001646 [Coptis chinensis]